MVIAESAAESSLSEPMLEHQIIELETVRDDHIISEVAICDTAYEVCHMEEKNFEILGSRECFENNTTVEVLENGAVELTGKGTEVLYNLIDEFPVEPATMMVDEQYNKATLSIEPDGQVLLVSESDVKEKSTMENGANQAPEVLYDLIGELPVEGLASNVKEGNKDDDADIAEEGNKDDDAGNAEIFPKKKVKKAKKVVKKKKIVKRKAVVAEDESKSQFLDVHEPVVEVRTDENEENPELAPSDEFNNSMRVRKRKKKKSQPPSETGGRIYEAKPKKSEKKARSGKEKVEYDNKKVDHKEEAKSEGKVKKLKKRKRSEGDPAKGNVGELVAEDAEPSKSPESSNKVKTMGMIFMCSSKTKEECFRHNILGLPASKKDIVLTIYKGMRLFLFDFQSRLLYGIYKAKGPGGYNIEPDVFNSKFPSQVRFTILKDCLPLPEEQFKKVIKDNYYARNKFDCQLNPDQVKNLCKLFSATAKKKTKLVGETPRVGARPIFEQEKKRRAEDDADRDRKKRRARNDGKWEMERRRANYNERRPYQTSYSQRTISSGNPQHAVVYEREAYVPPERPTHSYVALQPLPPPAPAYTLSYPYGRNSRTDIYGQERTVGHQDRGLSYPRLRYLDEGSSHPYPYTSTIVHQDRSLPHSRLRYLDEGRSDSYTEPVVYRSPRYYTSARQDYSPSAVAEDEYRPSSSRMSYYQVPLPPHRRY